MHQLTKSGDCEGQTPSRIYNTTLEAQNNNVELKRMPVQSADGTSVSSKPTKTMTTSAALGDRNVTVASAIGVCFVTSATRKQSASSNISSS